MKDIYSTNIGEIRSFLVGENEVYSLPPEIDSSGITVGRDGSKNSDELDIVLDDEYVSARHFVITGKQGALHIADNNSTNGTVVSGYTLNGTAKRLRNGDVIKAGKSSLRVVEGQLVNSLKNPINEDGTRLNLGKEIFRI